MATAVDKGNGRFELDPPLHGVTEADLTMTTEEDGETVTATVRGVDGTLLLLSPGFADEAQVFGFFGYQING